MKYFPKIFIIYFFCIYAVYSQYEFGLSYNIGSFYKNKFINSLYNTYYKYYQFNEAHTIKKDALNYNYDIELYFLTNEIFYTNDFLRFGIGNYRFSPIYSYFFDENTQYQNKWSGEYNALFIDYGILLPIKKQLKWEFFGGLGLIPDFRLYYNYKKTSQSLFQDPFELGSGDFYNTEGMLFRMGVNLLYKKNSFSFRVGMNYQYILSGLFHSNDSSINWYWINQEKIWITKDVYYYVKNKEQYESENRNILQPFPRIESVKAFISTYKIFFSVGFSY